MAANNENNALQDEEITLKSGDSTLYVSPWGASLRGLVANEVTEIITRYKGSDKIGGQGDVLIPFPGRIRDGKYTFEGKEYQLPLNDADGPNAIHGFVRKKPWAVVEQTEVSARFALDLNPDETPGYPFPLHVEVNYEVTVLGVEVKYWIKNTGSTNAPVAAGFHPYFTVGAAFIDDATLTLPFNKFLEFDGLLPTGKISWLDRVELDFREERLIGPVQFNNCFLDPIRDQDGNVTITLRSSDAYTSVHVTFGPEIDYVVLYTGDVLPEGHRRRALAIEPMTAGSDAFNYAQWGLSVLEPGETLSGKWSVTYQVT